MRPPSADALDRDRREVTQPRRPPDSARIAAAAAAPRDDREPKREGQPRSPGNPPWLSPRGVGRLRRARSSRLRSEPPRLGDRERTGGPLQRQIAQRVLEPSKAGEPAASGAPTTSTAGAASPSSSTFEALHAPSMTSPSLGFGPILDTGRTGEGPRGSPQSAPASHVARPSGHERTRHQREGGRIGSAPRTRSRTPRLHASVAGWRLAPFVGSLLDAARSAVLRRVAALDADEPPRAWALALTSGESKPGERSGQARGTRRISTRRFRARPSGVSFGSTGRSAP